jgi:putative transposase
MNKAALAREMGVSRGSLYYRSTLEAKDEQLKQDIRHVLEKHPAYGHRRIALELGCNKKRILRVMKKYNITPIIRRTKKKVGTSAPSKHSYENWLEKLCPICPNVLWASDFTYIRFQERWLYMATIIDIFTRELIGIAFSWSHDQSLVTEALHHALSHRSIPQYLHSDPGSEYLSSAYITAVESLGITVSISPKGKPWKNGYQESFYSQFKLELGPVNIFQHHGALLEAIYRQVHYYNHHRIHLALKMPPAMFHQQCSPKGHGRENVKMSLQFDPHICVLSS